MQSGASLPSHSGRHNMIKGGSQRVICQRIHTLLFFTAAVIIAGCAGGTEYLYRISTDGCNCTEFHLRNESAGITYVFRGTYRMDHGVMTNVEVEFQNRSRDTLFLDPGAVRITSRNIQYRYNDKFIPLPELIILPSHSDVVHLNGSDPSQTNDWNKIAGEQLMVTLRGILLGRKELQEQTVTFVPENPKLKMP